jgi:hypothetical protein
MSGGSIKSQEIPFLQAYFDVQIALRLGSLKDFKDQAEIPFVQAYFDIGNCFMLREYRLSGSD